MDEADVRDLLGEARHAARTLRRLRLRRESMRRSTGVRAQGYEPRVSGTRADVNGTDATVALLDAAPALDAQIARCERTLGALRRFLFGADGVSGASRLVGYDVAGMLWDHYGEDEDWQTVSRAWGADARHACSVACDVIDASGIASASMGLGVAEG